MRLIDADVLYIPNEETNARMAVAYAPTVDAEPVRHGRWVKTGQSFLFPERFMNYSCSLCGYDIDKTKNRYCPNCGAKMFDKDTDVPDKNVGKMDGGADE